MMFIEGRLENLTIWGRTSFFVCLVKKGYICGPFPYTDRIVGVCFYV